MARSARKNVGCTLKFQKKATHFVTLHVFRHAQLKQLLVRKKTCLWMINRAKGGAKNFGLGGPSYIFINTYIYAITYIDTYIHFI